MDPKNEAIETNETLDPIAAMDEGIAMADKDEGIEPAPEVVEPEQVEPEPELEPEADPEADPEAEPELEVSPEDAAKAEIEAEADALGLKPGKSRDRFHELTSQVREAAPVMEAIKAANVKAEDLPDIIARAESHVEWVKHVVDTGATPEQYGMTLEFLGDIGAAGKGDMVAAERAFEKVMGEAKALASLLGRPIEGVYDPLDGHDDLKGMVDDLTLDRTKALEIARDRQTAAAIRESQTNNAAATTEASAQAQGIQSLVQIDAHLQANDPDYDRKRPMLNAMVANIRATLPPNQWATATQQAYATIPAMPAPVVVPKRPVGRVPARGGGTHGRMQQAQFDDPMAALDAGIASAS